MIDLVYQTLLTIVNKENQGYVTPTEFNLLANTVQLEIFRGYFSDENRDKNKSNRGISNTGYSNLDFNERQRIQQFAEITTVAKADSKFTLPADIYFIEDDGVTTAADQAFPSKVIEEVERSAYGYLSGSLSAPTALRPVYERYSDNIVVYPDSITNITLRYLREPKAPQWTYFSLSSGDPIFNPANESYQDFELHPSEFSNIVTRMGTYLGLNLREEQVISVSELLKDKANIKEES